MNTLHSTLRLGLLLLALFCSMVATAQTEGVIRNNDYQESLQSSNEGDSIAERVFTGKIYDVVEEPPSFPDGSRALMSWLTENTHYPSEYGDICISGRVVLSFVVEPDGSLSNINVVRSVDPLLDKEAIKVVKSMPRWIPGKQNGKEVRVKYNLPVSFKLR